MKIINLGIMAHVDAGKTTVTEGLLYHSGAIKRMGRVDQGTTITDSMEIEQKRGMTVRSSTVSFEWENTKINLIDTPGHMDFVAEVERSLSVIDGVILVISAKEGVQPQTRVIFRKLQELKIPTILFLNKVDRMGVCVSKVLEDIKKQLTTHFIVLQELKGEGSREVTLSGDVAIWEQGFCLGESRNKGFVDVNVCDRVREGILIESDLLMQRYLDSEVIEEEEYGEVFLSLVRRATTYPLLFGSALSDIGVKELLSAVTGCFIRREMECSYTAYVYKIERDRRKHKRIFFRVLDGAVCLKKKYRIRGREGHAELFVASALFALQHGKMMPVDSISCGDIGIVCDVAELKCGDYFVLSDKLIEEEPAKKSYELARPLLQVVIRPTEPKNRHELLSALKELAEEDPFLEVRIDPKTEEIRMQLFGKLQMEVVESLLRDRYHIGVEFGDLLTTYKEHPSQRATVTIPFQDERTRLYAGATISVEPLPPGSGFDYVNKVSYGYLEKSFQHAALEGIKLGLLEGLEGHEVIDVRVTFEDAVYDSVMGTPSDFRKLMPFVIKKALTETGISLLEPWLTYDLTAPILYEKNIISELTKMRAIMEGIVYNEEDMTIIGRIPLNSSKNYACELATYTEGKGIVQTEFYQYQ